MQFSKTTLIGIALAIVLLGVGYLYFFSGSPEEAPLTTNAPSSPAEIEFLQLVNELDPISFNTSILQDPRFLGLTDLATPVTDEPNGRTDPFAPLGASAATPKP